MNGERIALIGTGNMAWHLQLAFENAGHAITEIYGRDYDKAARLTRNSYQNALLTLENIGFSDIFTADNVMAREQARPKPDPEGLNLLLEKWQAAPAEAVFVGDFRDDFIAGRAAGMHTIYVDYDERNQWNDYCHTRVVQLDHLLENQ